MGYTFKSLCIRNFKYITNNKPLKFDFMNSNIVILDGQNGYGKTTLFDAIEVLVTGKIKHFNPSLQNRKTETLGILANDVNKDIVISAILEKERKAMHWIIRMRTVSISRYWFPKRSISPRQEMNQPCMLPLMQRRARTSR